MQLYTWTKHGKIATLDTGIYQTNYNEASLKLCIENITSQRDIYVTYEAWKAQLDMFNQGLKILTNV